MHGCSRDDEVWDGDIIDVVEDGITRLEAPDLSVAPINRARKAKSNIRDLAWTSVEDERLQQLVASGSSFRDIRGCFKMWSLNKVISQLQDFHY